MSKTWNYNISKKEFIKLLKREKHIYQLGFYTFPSIDYNIDKLLLYNVNLKANLMTKKKYNKFMKNSKNTYLFIPNTPSNDKIKILQVKDVKKCPFMKVESSVDLVCYVDNYIPYIIINNNIIKKLQTQNKYSSKKYVSDLLHPDDKYLAKYRYSNRINERYKNKISQKFLLCFAKKCRINKDLIIIKFTLKPKIVELMLVKKVKKHDLRNFLLPPKKIVIKNPLNVIFEFYL